MSIERDPSRPHPSAERLAAYAREYPAGEDATDVGQHLTQCRWCRRIVLNLQDRSEADDDQLEAAWTAMRARIRQQPAAGAEAPGPPLLRHQPMFPWAVAALLLLTVGLSVGLFLRAGARIREAEGRIARLERELVELRAPHAQVVEIDLFPRRTLRGDEAPALTVPAATRLVILRLQLAPANEVGPQRLEIVDGRGETVSSFEGVEPDALGQADVALPRDLLPAGVNRLRLVPGEGASSEAVTEYVLRVEYEDPGK